MKIVITIITLFLIYSFLNKPMVTFNHYYVSNTGSDVNSGTSSSLPWQTIAQVNSFGGFNSGDTISFQSNGVWNERLVPPNSNLYFNSFGVGNKPLITGFQSITLSNTSGNIWSGTASNSVLQQNTILVNGKLAIKARYPNSGYSIFISSIGDSVLITSLSGTPNYTGYECTVRVSQWVIDVLKVKSQSGDTLRLNGHLTYTPVDGRGYFLQNNASLLDTLNEFSYDSTSKVLSVYATSLPTVQFSSIDTSVWVRSKSNITFTGISFTGANRAAIQLDTCSFITIQNCSFNNLGTLCISGKKSNHVSVLNDSIQNTLSGAVYLRRVDPYTPTQDTCNYATVSGNYIHNTATYAGMGMNGNGRYTGIFIVGLQPQILNNQVDSTGYIPIQFNGQKSLVKNNYVTNFCFVKEDGGGIYQVIGGYFPSTFNDSSVIRGNIVVNGIGNAQGTVGGLYAAVGIYLDDYEKSVTVDSNTIYKCLLRGMFLNQATHINIFANTIIDSVGDCFYAYNGDIRTDSIRGNSFLSLNSSFYLYDLYTGYVFGASDSNYFSRPSLESGALSGKSLAQWQSAYSLDLHSKITPSNITTANPVILYNPTFSSVAYALGGLYIDIKGNQWNNSITIDPFRSSILYKANYEIPVPPNIYNRSFKLIQK